MHKFHPSNFFDLSRFRHAALFAKTDSVWEVIPKIGPYLASLPLGKIEIEIPQGVHLINPEKISIGKGTVIEPGAYIKGPCVIGENCIIRHGAYIRGDLIAGNQCVIGHATEIKHSILLDGAQAAHFAYVGDSILGSGVNLGAGTKCANLKFDHGMIYINHERKKIETGLRKFGVIMGDGAQTGCNAVTNPGTIMGKNACCYPCVSFGGIIDADAIVKPSKKPHIASLARKR